MKYDIELPNPFWLGIEISESEDSLPSVGCKAELRLQLPKGEFSYKTSEFWFECSVFDSFLSNLKALLKGGEVKAEFYDIDREILYVFTAKDILVSVHRIHSEKGTGYMEFKADYDADIILQHIQSLENFDKWW